MSSKVRFFNNPMEDYNEGSAEDVIEHSQISLKSPVVTFLESKWFSTIDKLQQCESSDYSVYTGTAGIALLKLKRAPDDIDNLKEIKKLLQLDKLKKHRFTFLCGDAGPLAIGAVACYKLGQHDEVKVLIKRLTEMKKLLSGDDCPNEYLYGRSGYLYALLFVNKYIMPSPVSEDLVRQIIDAMLKFGMQKAVHLKAGCPLMYEWHGSFYLGAAHGLTGIIYLLLQAKNYLSDAELTSVIKPTIDYLRSLRYSSGNYPSSLGSDSDKYVQWCHGSPGFVYMFCMAYRVYGEAKYLQDAVEAGEVVWKRGLLKKGYSLCHGVSGNAYCFLELYQTTKDDKHLYRAVKFAEWCVNYNQKFEEHPPDRPNSLYEGISGPMYLLLDMQKPLDAKFPGFTL